MPGANRLWLLIHVHLRPARYPQSATAEKPLTMFEPDLRVENALRFSRFDAAHPLSTCDRRLELEGQVWRSAEHYVHSMLAASPELAEKTRACESGLEAWRLNKPWYRRKKHGWKSQRRVYMTRALYTLVQMYPDVHDYLLETGDQLLVEASQYDYYWGIGRDLRGENMTGKIWMDIRNKLRREADGSTISKAAEGK